MQAETKDHRIAVVLSHVATVLAVGLPLLATLERLRRPTGEKFLFAWLGGSADLWLPFHGAAAIVRHIDPYGPLPPDLRDPMGWPSTYPPTMLALYVPFVWLTRSKIELACQIFFWLNVLAVGALSFAIWRLSSALASSREPGRDTPFLVMLIPLALSVPTAFAIDRGQSELINAALLWSGVLLFIRRKQASAMALVCVASAIKGYAAPVALGLLIAAPNKRAFLRGAAAATIVTALLTLPVAPYLRHGFTSMLRRVDFMFEPVWYNHSFKNTVHTFAPKLSDPGRLAISLLAVAATIAAGWRLVAARRRGDAELTLRTLVFASAATSLMIGLPVYSGPYNYLLVLPGLLLLGVQLADVQRILELGRSATLAIGGGLVLCLALALRFRWFESPVPLAGIALVGFVICAGALASIRSAQLESTASNEALLAEANSVTADPLFEQPR